MGSVPTSLGEWIHSPWFGLGLVVWKGYRPRVRLVLAGGHASAWISPFLAWPCTGSPKVPSGNLCETGNLGSMESNVMAGRALFGRLQLPDGQRRCAIFLVQEKVMQCIVRIDALPRSYLS